jgi:molecular chaperone DnaK (HSP70)
MRKLTPLLATACLLACSTRSLVVEESSPLVGPNGMTTEALGVASPYGEFITVIPQGTRVPCTQVQTFATSHRNAGRIEFALFRGNGMDTRDNHALGRYGAPKPMTAKGRPAPIEVTFAIGTDRKISLSAREVGSGKGVTLTREP